MKTKITFMKWALVAFTFFSFNNLFSQTYFYQDAVENGTIWHNGATDVSNPLSDSVNSSSIVLQNDGSASWQETQLFPSGYTIQSGDQFYISFYNPNGAANWQLRMDLSTSGSFTQISGADPAHDAGASSGWVEVSLDLSSYVGEDVTKIQLYPVAGESISINYDNIYIKSSSGGTATETYFFKDAAENGTIWHSAGAEVANPLSDSGNSSATVIQNTGAAGWEETQFFPTSYNIKSGDKFYMSVYNPNGAAAWQLKMDLSSSGNTWIGEPTYVLNASSGWTEMSLDLSSYAGEDITKIFVYPAAGESKSVYYDTVYIHTSSVISTPSTQTYFYQEAVENGTIWHNGVTDVSNPLSDAVNSSNIVLQNDGTVSWQETQLFPSSYTIKTGDKFYISFYNPNGAANWQLRMDLSTSGSFTQIGGGDPAHDANASSGWTEVSLDLSSYIGENISKIQLYPAAGESISINYDNIYISSASVLNTENFIKQENKLFVDTNGVINFYKTQSNTTLYIFDLKGALVLKEEINSKKSINSLKEKGLYFIKVKNNLGFSNHKVLFH
jgi:hypothetical protein